MAAQRSQSRKIKSRTQKKTSQHSKGSAGGGHAKKIGYAVVGLGHIAQVAILPGFKNARKNSELVALVAEDPIKLKKLAKKYKVNHVYSPEEFEECLENEQVDAVYIATPNTAHQVYAESAMRKGVHVLCEKPLAADQESCEALIKAAAENPVHSMVAYRLHFDPANLKAVQIAQSGKLGDLRFLTSTFSYNIQDRDNIRLKLDQAGGPLHDIGIYCINAARYLFRAEPYEVFAFASTNPNDERFSEVDEMISVIMKFPEHRIAQFICSFGAAAISRFDLVGTKGSLAMDSAYEYVEPMELTVTINEKKQKHRFGKHDQFGAEISYFSDCILKNRAPEPSFLEGLADIVVIEAILESLQSRAPVEVRSIRKDQRPTEEQAIRMPPISKPTEIRSTGPTG